MRVKLSNTLNSRQTISQRQMKYDFTFDIKQFIRKQVLYPFVYNMSRLSNLCILNAKSYGHTPHYTSVCSCSVMMVSLDLPSRFFNLQLGKPEFILATFISESARKI